MSIKECVERKTGTAKQPIIRETSPLKLRRSSHGSSQKYSRLSSAAIRSSCWRTRGGGGRLAWKV